jgi:hypothetical protein
LRLVASARKPRFEWWESYQGVGGHREFHDVGWSARVCGVWAAGEVGRGGGECLGGEMTEGRVSGKVKWERMWRCGGAGSFMPWGVVGRKGYMYVGVPGEVDGGFQGF